VLQITMRAQPVAPLHEINRIGTHHSHPTQSANPFKKTFNWMCSSDIIFKDLVTFQPPRRGRKFILSNQLKHVNKNVHKNLLS